MVKKMLRKTKSVLFADPNLLYKEEHKQHLIKKSFYFQGNNGKAVLLIHGWSTTPYEVRRLGEYLNENGYTVYGPMLSGHGTKYQDLESVKYMDWFNDAQVAYRKLKQDHNKVFIGGTSMGANLSICLAKREKDIDGLILMATPYRMKFEKLGEIAINLISKFKKYHKKFYPPTFGLSTTITRLIAYQTYPIKNVLELGELVKKSREDLEKISQPCLVLQSTHDHIVTKDSLEKIYNRISSKIKKKKYIKKAYHTFISDIKNEHVFEDILNFINKI
jgi:carboxylesterase